MTDSDSNNGRQASEINVTPEMVEAGRNALVSKLGGYGERFTEFDEEIVRDVFFAMLVRGRAK